MTDARLQLRITTLEGMAERALKVAREARELAENFRIKMLAMRTPPQGERGDPGPPGIAPEELADLIARLEAVEAMERIAAPAAQPPSPALAPVRFSKGAVWVGRSYSDSLVAWRADHPCRAVAVRGFMKGVGIAYLNAGRVGAGPLVPGLGLHIARGGEWVTETTLQNAEFAVGDTLELIPARVDYEPESVSIQVDFERLPR